MSAPDKPTSVTYDANRIRMPPEKPSNKQPEKVSEKHVGKRLETGSETQKHSDPPTDPLMENASKTPPEMPPEMPLGIPSENLSENLSEKLPEAFLNNQQRPLRIVSDDAFQRQLRSQHGLGQSAAMCTDSSLDSFNFHEPLRVCVSNSESPNSLGPGFSISPQFLKDLPGRPIDAAENNEDPISVSVSVPASSSSGNEAASSPEIQIENVIVDVKGTKEVAENGSEDNTIPEINIEKETTQNDSVSKATSKDAPKDGSKKENIPQKTSSQKTSPQKISSQKTSIQKQSIPHKGTKNKSSVAKTAERKAPKKYLQSDSGSSISLNASLHEKSGLSRTMSRIRSQLPSARRYSSEPSATKEKSRLRSDRSSKSPSPGPVSSHDPLFSHKPTRSLSPPYTSSHSFSFSEADDSVLEVSPARDSFSVKGTPFSVPGTSVDEPSAPVNLEGTPSLGKDTPKTGVMFPPPMEYVNEASPPKSLSSSINSNIIGSIIGTYDYSSSSLALGDPKSPEMKPQVGASTDTPVSSNPSNSGSNAGPEKYFPLEAAPKLNHPKHDRQDSQSSAVSSASSSTLTSAHNNQQRFMRYVMSTQTKSSTYSSRWSMDNVLGWLETHRFPDIWKETFRRNEISGNRFLELGNYDSSSAVWRQLSQTLGTDGNQFVIDRFINLLGSEPLDLESTASSVPSQSYLDTDAYGKLENRKSASTLWTQGTPAVSTKQRPFSYVESGNQKQTKEHGKFFRKHTRLSSTESGKEPSANSSHNKSSGNSSHGKPGEASSGSGNLGFKKSGILSTLRKYGGEKAAGIVKQVHTHPSSSKHSSNKRISNGFSNVLQKKSDQTNKMPEFSRKGSEGSSPGYPEDSSKSPNSMRSIAFDENTSVTPVPKLVHQLRLEDFVDHEYLPVSSKKHHEIFSTILLTRDNHSFVPFDIESKLLGNIDVLKEKFIHRLDMLNIGTITYHITDFDSNCGVALPDELLHSVLVQGLVTKLKIEQNFQSPDRFGTFSSTSSDSKSFDTSGGKRYPETPQYMLQHSSDKNVDYMNFKDSNRFAKDPDMPPLPSFGASDRTPSGSYPFNLSMPQSKRLQSANSTTPALNKRGLPLINTTHPPAILAPPYDPDSQQQNSANSKSSASSFSVVRREGREIDFDKRRLNPNESKAPRLIPNIYSSSVTDSSVSPISASTIHAFKDEKALSPSGASMKTGTRSTRALSSASDLEKGASFVARRKAPPPPTASNSLKISKKKSTSNLGASPGSTRSDIYQLSNDSIDSFRSSQARSKAKTTAAPVAAATATMATAKTFDFSDAPSLELPSQICGRDNSDSDDDDDDDVFFKPLQVGGGPKTSDKDILGFNKEDFAAGSNTKHNDLVLDSMTLRPSVDEVYDNLEKYFPNTILDKPIIDAYPDSPSVSVIRDSMSSKPAMRKPSISRTFSNANISPVHPEKGPDDEVFYGDGSRLRRMKTIRAVANEAHRKRLATQKAAVKESGEGKPTKKETPQIKSMTLGRANTKLWGQKVVEVTSDEIEKGFVGRIRKIANKTVEEFAWVKGELIGRGSFGSVFLALNVTTGEMLAVKQVNVSEGKNPKSDGIDAFHKEVETMKDLDHLNIVQYLGFEQSNHTYSLFLEYVAGGSVSSCLKSYGKFDEPLVKFITRQVLEGLTYLHENGILHRDLKADNLLLEIDGVCKISDFGISKRSQDIYSNNAEMSMQGTVFWMAPEVIHSMVEEKKQGYSAKVDIWSLGCVMLEMFAGQRPWSNEAVVSAIYKLGKTKLAPPIPADVSQEAKDFLNKCFTIDSEKRPTAAELLSHRFMEIDNGFQFSQTRLSDIIKSNSTRNMVKG